MQPILTYHYPSIDSTQSEAKRLIDSGSELPFAVQSDEQTNGRGREDREWISPVGNLYATLAFTPKIPVVDWPQFSLAAAVTWLDCIRADLKFKWPNDLILDDKKVGGILVERYKDSVLIGMGINCNSYPEGKLLYPTTSLAQSLDQEIEPKQLLEDYLNAASADVVEVQSSNLNHIRNRWLDHGYNLNNEVSVRFGQKTINGIFKGLDQQGNLLLESNGAIECLRAGEIME